MIITEHAFQRARARMGLNREAFARTAAKAFESGAKLEDTRGKVQRYIEGLLEKKQTADNTRIYGEFVYVFCGAYLVTVHHLPKEYRNYKQYQHEAHKTKGTQHRGSDHRMAAGGLA